MSTVSEIADVLTALGTVGPVFDNILPATPHAAVAVIEADGAQESQGGFSVEGIKHERPKIRVVARGVPMDHDGPRTAIARAYVELAKICSQTLGGTYYLKATALNPPYLLGRDDLGRVSFATLFEFEKELSA